MSTITVTFIQADGVGRVLENVNVPGGASLAIADTERAEIVEAIADRDATAASQLMEEHVRGKPGRARHKTG
jgi:DNA-binding GntR family transcriptional regulator